MRDLLESGRFMLANPEELSKGEVGEGRIGDELDEFFAADGGV